MTLARASEKPNPDEVASLGESLAERRKSLIHKRGFATAFELSLPLPLGSSVDAEGPAPAAMVWKDGFFLISENVVCGSSGEGSNAQM
jgi:hypothetical protein